MFMSGSGMLLKVYSSLNVHHLIRERFHEGVDLSLPVTHPQSYRQLASIVQRDPICDPLLFHSILSHTPLPLCNDNLAIPNTLLACLDWQGGGLERAWVWDSSSSHGSFLGVRRAI